MTFKALLFLSSLLLGFAVTAFTQITVRETKFVVVSEGQWLMAGSNDLSGYEFMDIDDIEALLRVKFVPDENEHRITIVISDHINRKLDFRFFKPSGEQLNISEQAVEDIRTFDLKTLPNGIYLLDIVDYAANQIGKVKITKKG